MAEIIVGSEDHVLDVNAMSSEHRQRQISEEERNKKEELKRVRKSPFANFTQINKAYYKEEDWLLAKSPIAYRIFKFLINNMDEYNAVICSYKVLQETFDISKITVSRSVKILKERGYVAVFKSGTSNVYAVNDRIAWNSWGTNYQYSKFPANIILSLSEQEKSIRIKFKTLKQKKVELKEVDILPTPKEEREVENGEDN